MHHSTLSSTCTSPHTQRSRRTAHTHTRPTTTRKASVRAREQAAMHVAPSVRGGECSCVRHMRQHLAACGARGTRASIGGLSTHPNYWAPPGSWGTCACALGSVTWTVAAQAEDLRPPLLRADRHDGCQRSSRGGSPGRRVAPSRHFSMRIRPCQADDRHTPELSCPSRRNRVEPCGWMDSPSSDRRFGPHASRRPRDDCHCN